MLNFSEQFKLGFFPKDFTQGLKVTEYRSSLVFFQQVITLFTFVLCALTTKSEMCAKNPYVGESCMSPDT